jgi:hypothetical protein
MKTPDPFWLPVGLTLFLLFAVLAAAVLPDRSVNYQTVRIDSCDYIVFMRGSSLTGIHKAKCKNPEHGRGAK